MLDNGRISSLEFILLLSITMLASAISFMPNLISIYSWKDAWLAGPLYIAVSLPFVLVWAKLGMLFPGKSLIEYTEKIFGKVTGTVINLILLTFLVSLTSITVKEFSFEMNLFYQETPELIIILVMIIIVCIGTFLGIETIGRANILIFIGIFFFTFVLLALLPFFTKIDVNNLLPLLEKGLGPPFLGALNPIAWGGQLVFSLIFLPNLNKVEDTAKVYIVATIIIGSFGTVVETLQTAVLGKTRQETIYSILELLRVIPIKIDIFLFTFWIAAIIIKITVFFYASTIGLSQFLRLKDYRPIILPLAIFVVSYALVTTPRFMDIYNFGKVWPYMAIPLEMGLPTLMLIIALIKFKEK